MMELLPEGSPIGRLQASFQWVLAHTSRFRGLMTVTMGEGEGFILIDRGKPIGCFFQRGENILRGKAAYTYFMGLPLVDLSLRRYNAEELGIAIRVLKPPERGATLPAREVVVESGGKEVVPVVLPDAPRGSVIVPEGAEYHKEERREIPGEEPKGPAGQELPVYPRKETEKPLERQEEGSKGPSGIIEPVYPEEEPWKSLEQKGPEYPDEKIQRPLEEEEPVSHDREKMASGEGEPVYLVVDMPAPEESAYPEGELPGYPDGLDNETLGHLLMGRILRLPGVQAVSIFGRGRSLLSVGNADIDSLVLIAEDILEAAKGISTVINTGPLLHLTLQIPTGNLIITPYFNEYLCIFTGPKVNLGQVRKILKEIPARSETRRNGT